MSKISQARIEKIKEEILLKLYENYPAFLYTYQISDLMLRDDEFILRLLNQLKELNLITSLEESKGKNIKKKWSLKTEVYNKYKELLDT